MGCLILAMTIGGPLMKAENKKDMNIVFIGNSITQGAIIQSPTQDAPPANVVLYLTKQSSVNYSVKSPFLLLLILPR